MQFNTLYIIMIGQPLKWHSRRKRPRWECAALRFMRMAFRGDNMEETINMIAMLINQVGFPIACCAIMFWYLNKERESHEQEVNSLKEALNSNTQILTELKTMFTYYMPVQRHNGAENETVGKS